VFAIKATMIVIDNVVITAAGLITSCKGNGEQGARECVRGTREKRVQPDLGTMSG
jgi:hypothetical protein